jgi:hypothetical protein
MLLVPPPVQKPRIPIWLVGVWDKPKSMHRALSWDGIIPQKFRDWHPLSPDDIQKVSDHVAKHRQAKGPFEIICGASTGGKKTKRPSEIVRPFIDAGATWWVEPDPPPERIRQGPPVS